MAGFLPIPDSIDNISSFWTTQARASFREALVVPHEEVDRLVTTVNSYFMNMFSAISEQEPGAHALADITLDTMKDLIDDLPEESRHLSQDFLERILANMSED